MWWERDRAHNIYLKINYDFVNNYLYLYPTIRPILISRIICIRLSGKFYYPELSVSGYPANFTIRASQIARLVYYRIQWEGVQRRKYLLTRLHVELYAAGCNPIKLLQSMTLPDFLVRQCSFYIVFEVKSCSSKGD